MREGIAHRTHTFATAGSLADTDAFKTSVATSETAVVYEEADLNGALANPGPVTESKMGLPRYPSVTTSASASTYNTTDPIVWNGTRDGIPVTVETKLTNAGGDQTIVASSPLDTVTGISVPAQDGASGAFQFGFSGVACRRRHGTDNKLLMKPVGSGTVKVGYPGDFTDNLAVSSHQHEPVTVSRVYADTTDVGVVLYE